MKLNQFMPQSGRFLREDGTLIDITRAYDELKQSFVSMAIFQKKLYDEKVYSAFVKDFILQEDDAYFAIQTGSNSVLFSVDTLVTDGDKISLQLFENATISGGTTINLINRNRVSSLTCSATAVKNPTVTDEGSQIDELYAGGTYGPVSKGGTELEAILPFRLLPNTTYLIKITNLGTVDTNVLVRFSMIED